MYDNPVRILLDTCVVNFIVDHREQIFSEM